VNLELYETLASTIEMTKTNLSYEIWDTIFGDNDVNKILNNFHYIF